MHRILLLSTTTGYQLRSFSEAAEALGIELLFATDRCGFLEDPWRDQAVPVRFHEDEPSVAAVRREARDRRVDGIVALGDRPVVLAARVAAALGLPGNPVDAAMASAHKRLARERFARAGLPVPRYVPATIHSGVDQLLAEVGFPAVLKPVGLSGSRGVIRVDDPAELRAAFDRVCRLLSRPDVRVQRTGMEDELLIEAFIPGREYAVEGLLTRGRFQPLALFDKPDPLDGPFFEETLYVTPSRSTPGIQRDIIGTVAQAVQALGLWHGPVHAECRVNRDGVFILEVAARPIGGLCSRVLRFTAPEGTVEGEGRTVSLEQLLLRHAIGEDVSAWRREHSAAAVMMIPIPRRGVFRGVHGGDRARQVPDVEEVRITAKPDQLLEALPEAGSYLGFVFARAGTPEAAEAAAREAHRRLDFSIDAPITVRAVS